MNATAADKPAHPLRIDRQALSASRRRPAWLWPAVGLLALVLVGAWLALSQRGETVQSTPVVMSLPSQQFVDLTASGYVVAQRRAAVASKATGRLIELNVREGAKVRKGQVLARLDASDVRAAMAAASAGVLQAQAALRQTELEQANAQADFNRSKGLEAQGFISPQAVDAARTRQRVSASAVAAARATVAAAKAQLDVQKVNQDYTEIRAPFDGVVLVKNANVGDIITPFSSAAGSQGAVVTMADMSTLEVEADVSESSLGKTRVGQSVEVVLDALPDVRFRGVVGGVVPTVDRAKATVVTKIRFESIDPRILPEMSAKVNFLSRAVSVQEQQPVMAVNPQALQKLPQSEGRAVVWKIIAQGDAAAASLTVEPVEVTLGRKIAEVVEVSPVKAGSLKSGDKLVLAPSDKLAAGSVVKLAKP